MNLGELVRGGQYRRILNLIHHLPQASHYYQAMVNDDEYVALVVETSEGQPEQEAPSPPLSTWTPTVDKLAGVQDLLAQILSVSIAAAGGKPGKTKPVPRPATKFDEAKARKLRKKQSRVLGLIEQARQRQEVAPRLE